MAFDISILPNGMAQLVDTETGDFVRYSLFEGDILGHWSGTNKPEYRKAVAKFTGGAEYRPATSDGRPSGAIAGLIAERTFAHENSN